MTPEGSDDEPARIMIRNVTDQPLLTVNWRLSVGARAVTLPSVRLEAGERRAFTAERLGIDGWLNAGAGRLVLRDAPRALALDRELGRGHDLPRD